MGPGARRGQLRIASKCGPGHADELVVQRREYQIHDPSEHVYEWIEDVGARAGHRRGQCQRPVERSRSEDGAVSRKLTQRRGSLTQSRKVRRGAKSREPLCVFFCGARGQGRGIWSDCPTHSRLASTQLHDSGCRCLPWRVRPDVKHDENHKREKSTRYRD